MSLLLDSFLEVSFFLILTEKGSMEVSPWTRQKSVIDKLMLRNLFLTITQTVCERDGTTMSVLLIIASLWACVINDYAKHNLY